MEFAKIDEKCITRRKRDRAKSIDVRSRPLHFNVGIKREKKKLLNLNDPKIRGDPLMTSRIFDNF